MTKKNNSLTKTLLIVAPLVNKHEFIKFLLTLWAGASPEIQILGLMVLAMIAWCEWRSNQIRAEIRQNQIASEKKPPAGTKNKQIRQNSRSKSKSKPNNNGRRGTSKTK